MRGLRTDFPSGSRLQDGKTHALRHPAELLWGHAPAVEQQDEQGAELLRRPARISSCCMPAWGASLAAVDQRDGICARPGFEHA